MHTFSQPARRVSLRSLPLLLVLGSLLLAACEPTPGYLRRWANTEGSEEKYIGYLQDPDLSHQVHVTALELLIEQWDYSMGYLSGGEAVRGMPDAAERDATLRDATPRLRALYDQGGEWTAKMRDAAFHLRQATADPEVRAGFDAVILDWLNNHFDPCEVSRGTVPTTQLLAVLDPAAATPKITEIVQESAFDRVLCFGRDVPQLEWMHSSDTVAAAYIARWESGNISENAQLRFELLEQMLRFDNTEPMREWMFAQLGSADADPLHKNLILDALSRDPSDADIEGYTELLGTETYARWAAFQAIVNARGSDGLEMVLSSLPATGEYGFYNGQVRPDGLKSVADNIVCALPKLTELGDNARVVFERHMSDANVPARLISISCLGRFGDRQTVQRLSAARAELGRQPVPAPGFGTDASIQGVIDEAIAAIQARLGS